MPSIRRQLSDGRQTEGVDKSAMRMRRFAFGGNVTVSTSTHRHYDESVHRITQLTRGNNTIGFSDILSRIRNSTTTGSAVRVVYRGPFMSEDRSFDLSTAARYVLFIADRSCRKIGVSTSQLHYFMLLCTGSTPGK